MDEQIEDATSRQLVDPKRQADPKYWNPKFVLINLTIVILAIIAGYLQYVAYPAVLSASVASGGYGESNVVLNLSFLTFQINAVSNCSATNCELRGVPAFDFCQAMIYLLIIVNLVHLFNLRRR